MVCLLKMWKISRARREAGDGWCPKCWLNWDAVSQQFSPRPDDEICNNRRKMSFMETIWFVYSTRIFRNITLFMWGTLSRWCLCIFSLPSRKKKLFMASVSIHLFILMMWSFIVFFSSTLHSSNVREWVGGKFKADDTAPTVIHSL